MRRGQEQGQFGPWLGSERGLFPEAEIETGLKPGREKVEMGFDVAGEFEERRPSSGRGVSVQASQYSSSGSEKRHCVGSEVDSDVVSGHCNSQSQHLSCGVRSSFARCLGGWFKRNHETTLYSFLVSLCQYLGP